MLKSSDESPVEFLVHNEKEGRKYVSILLKLMNNAMSDARAQHFAVSRYRLMLVVSLAGKRPSHTTRHPTRPIYSTTPHGKQQSLSC